MLIDDKAKALLFIIRREFHRLPPYDLEFIKELEKKYFNNGKKFYKFDSYTMKKIEKIYEENYGSTD